MLAPIDLVYVCGNKFLATNTTLKPVHVEYRVVGTDETGSLTLPEGSDYDPPQSETELETEARGAVELYRDGERLVRRPNEGLPCGPPALRAALMAGAAGAESGEWSAPFPTPIVPMHTSLLRTGKVLFWGSPGAPQVWDPETGVFTAVPSPVRLFCSGHSFLGDGRLLVSGGHLSQAHGLPDNTIFDPGDETWSQSMPMQRGRWYPTNTTLANGDVVTLAGRDQESVPVREPEVWSSGSVRTLGSATLQLPYYPRAFLAPNGKLFYAGELQESKYLDTEGGGGWTASAMRRYGTRSYGAAVMYDEGKILYVGGGFTTNTAEIIDLNSALPTWEWTGSMAYPRRHLNATVLPTGEVLVTGGTSGTVFNDITLAVRAAEIWNPATGVWTTLASNAVSRAYHSSSILLPDGRVLHGGSGSNGVNYEFSYELFSPPYLLKGPRPGISHAPSRVGYGGSFSVTSPDAADISRISLIRLGSATHAFDMNQRFQWLPFTREADRLTVSGPVSPNGTPVGHYLLFILNSEGVPSVGRIVRVASATSNAAPVAAFTQSCSGLACSFTDGSSDDAGLAGWSWSFGDEAGTSSEPSPAYTFAAEGSYEVTLTVTDDEGLTDSKVRTINVSPAPAAAFTPSCEGLTCSFADHSTDDAGVAGWSWDFGDGSGTSSESSPAYTYAAEGSYEVTLTVTDADGLTGSQTRTVNVSAAAPNQAPTAEFAWSCAELTCTFTDQSTDDGAIESWSWSFGDDVGSNERSPTRTFASGGSYEVTLLVSDAEELTGSRTQTISVTEPVPNQRPTASFSSSCTALACTFTDQSSDGDGSIARWSWSFGDGATSTQPNPSRTYAAPGSYQVTLAVTDDDGAEAQRSVMVTTTAPASITLGVAGRQDATKQYMTLTWKGASGSMVDVYRNGTRIKVTENDGKYVNSRIFTGPATYVYKVCRAGTTTCSNTATATFGGGTAPPPAIRLTVSGRTDAGKQYMALTWSGAAGTMVDVYRNGVRIKVTENDGKYTNSRIFTGPATYRYKVCQGGTATCSNEATVTFH